MNETLLAVALLVGALNLIPSRITSLRISKTQLLRMISPSFLKVSFSSITISCSSASLKKSDTTTELYCVIFKDETTPIRFWRHISDTIPLTPELAVDPRKMRNKRGVSCTKLSLQRTSFLVSMELFCSWFELLNSPCSTQYLLWLWNMKLNSQLSISVFLK